MTEAEAHGVLCAAVAAAWAPTGLPLVLPGEMIPSADELAAVTIVVTGAKQRSLAPVGDRRVHRSGWLIVKIWTLAGRGSARMLELAGMVRALEMASFDGPGIEPVNVEPSAGLEHATIDGRWLMGLVRMPFNYFEFK